MVSCFRPSKDSRLPLFPLPSPVSFLPGSRPLSRPTFQSSSRAAKSKFPDDYQYPLSSDSEIPIMLPSFAHVKLKLPKACKLLHKTMIVYPRIFYKNFQCGFSFDSTRTPNCTQKHNFRCKKNNRCLRFLILELYLINFNQCQYRNDSIGYINQFRFFLIMVFVTEIILISSV